MTANHLNATHEFAECAASYCALIDRQHDFTTKEFIENLRQLLPRLYYAALCLPDVHATDDELNLGHSVEDWREVTFRLQKTLGSNDCYWVVYDPLKMEHDEPCCGSLADDLADIWHDLKDGVSFWAEALPSTRQHIVWNWRFLFHHHWSHHLVDALRVINWIAEQYGVQ